MWDQTFQIDSSDLTEASYMKYLEKYVKFTYNGGVLLGYCIMREGNINDNRYFVAKIRGMIEDDYLGFSKIIAIPSIKKVPIDSPVIDFSTTFLLEAKQIEREIGVPPAIVLKDIGERIQSYKDIRLINEPEYFDTLHAELHRLKDILQLSRLPGKWTPPRLIEIIDQITDLLWFSKTNNYNEYIYIPFHNKHTRTPYKLFNPKPVSGGKFSPK